MYGWIKAFHIISVIAWMAGMLYLPRLFVYHCAAEKGSVQSETFKVMERRLLRGIINPAMIATYVFGVWLAWLIADSRYPSYLPGWLWAKIVLVLMLSGVHGMLAHWRKILPPITTSIRRNSIRIINEVPTAMMVGIVLLVVLKPF
jgi:putative membrane protein